MIYFDGLWYITIKVLLKKIKLIYCLFLVRNIKDVRVSLSYFGFEIIRHTWIDLADANDCQ